MLAHAVPGGSGGSGGAQMDPVMQGQERLRCPAPFAAPHLRFEAVWRQRWTSHRLSEPQVAAARPPQPPSLLY